MVKISALEREVSRLTERYNYYLTKALETIHFDEKEYIANLNACKCIRKQIANLNKHIKELEEK